MIKVRKVEALNLSRIQEQRRLVVTRVAVDNLHNLHASSGLDNLHASSDSMYKNLMASSSYSMRALARTSNMHNNLVALLSCAKSEQHPTAAIVAGVNDNYSAGQLPHNRQLVALLLLHFSS